VVSSIMDNAAFPEGYGQVSDSVSFFSQSLVKEKEKCITPTLINAL